MPMTRISQKNFRLLASRNRVREGCATGFATILASGKKPGGSGRTGLLACRASGFAGRAIRWMGADATRSERRPKGDGSRSIRAMALLAKFMVLP